MAEAEEPWGVRLPKSLLSRLRVACARRKAEGKNLASQKDVARAILEGWLRKVGE